MCVPKSMSSAVQTRAITNVIIPPNSSLSQNRLMSQECKISDWRVNYTRAITEGDEYPAMAPCQRITLCYRPKTWRE